MRFYLFFNSPDLTNVVNPDRQSPAARQLHEHSIGLDRDNLEHPEWKRIE